MAQQWFKFYGAEYLSDPKIDRLTPVERSCWITLLCMASQTTNGIIKYLTAETLLSRSGVKFDPYDTTEWDNGLTVLVKLENLKMLDVLDNGDIAIIHWEKRQEHNLTVAERVAKSRAKAKDVTINVTNVTSDKNRIDKNRIEEDKINSSFKKKQKAYYKPTNEEMRFSQGKWWVLPKDGSEWSEFAGSIKNDIIWK